MAKAPTYGRLNTYGKNERTLMGKKGEGIVVAAETWKGKVEVHVEDNGEFTVRLGPKYERGSTIITGNVGNQNPGNPEGKRYYDIGKGDLNIANDTGGRVEVS